MKRAKQHPPTIKPRDPGATHPLLKKGGAHARRDKKAKRALRRERDLAAVREAS
jgi:hypothetical protein